MKAKQIRKEFIHQFYRKNQLSFIVTLIMMILLAGVQLGISYLLRVVTDLAMGKELQPLLHAIYLTFGVVAAFILVYNIQRYSCAKFQRNAMVQYKNYIFRLLSQKSIQSFSGENTSKYISALTNDATSVETNYLSCVFDLLIKFVTFIGAFAMMIYYSPILTLAAVLFAIIPIVASLLCGNQIAVKEKAVSDKNEQFMGTVKDVLSGFPVVKSFKAELEIRNLYEQDNRLVEEAKYKKRLASGLVSLIGQTASIVAQMGVFILGAYLAIEGKGVTPGTVILFVQLMNFVVEPISTVPNLLANRKAASALIDKIAEALSENIRDMGEEVDSTLDQDLTLENVTFGYEEEKKVLKNIDYTFEAGKSYAIVGGSGSGKSTLLNLLMGGYSDYEGSIKLDGKELRQINSSSLYDMISIIQQNVFVFNHSIEKIITMFKDFDHEKVQEAIEMSGLSTLLEEKGQDYQCGENGCNLSGGERQRISIARSLLRESSVLLVDEATAALDAQTAYAVSSSILDLQGMTRIVVTHGLEEELLKRYDQILVLKNGKIQESGTFDELIEKKQYFYSLYNVAA